MTMTQIKQAQEAVRILRQVAAVALLNEIDRNNTNGAINFLNQLLEEESKINVPPPPAI